MKLTCNVRWRHYYSKWFLTSVHFCVEILFYYHTIFHIVSLQSLSDCGLFQDSYSLFPPLISPPRTFALSIKNKKSPLQYVKGVYKRGTTFVPRNKSISYLSQFYNGNHPVISYSPFSDTRLQSYLLQPLPVNRLSACERFSLLRTSLHTPLSHCLFP